MAAGWRRLPISISRPVTRTAMGICVIKWHWYRHRYSSSTMCQWARYIRDREGGVSRIFFIIFPPFYRTDHTGVGRDYDNVSIWLSCWLQSRLQLCRINKFCHGTLDWVRQACNAMYLQQWYGKDLNGYVCEAIPEWTLRSLAGGTRYGAASRRSTEYGANTSVAATASQCAAVW